MTHITRDSDGRATAVMERPAPPTLKQVRIGIERLIRENPYQMLPAGAFANAINCPVEIVEEVLDVMAKEGLCRKDLGLNPPAYIFYY